MKEERSMVHHSAHHTHEIDMLSGSLADKIVLFALPLAASSILQQLFNAADLAVVGRFASAEAMAAVGSNSSVINLIISLFVGLSVGANVLIASLIGTGHKENIRSAVHTIISVAFLSGCILTVVGILVSGPILRLMGAPLEVMNLAILYLRIYFLAMPAIMTFNFGSAILRSKGDSQRPLYALTASGILNIFLNLIFVVVFHLHVIGVALATVISNLLSAGMTLHFLMTEEEPYRLDLHRLTINKEHLIRMIQIGLPAGLQSAVFSLSNVVIQSTINSFGAAAIAGSTAVTYFDFFSYSLINAFAQAAVTFTSQNFGAKHYDRCKRVYLVSQFCGMGCSITIVTILVLLRYQVIKIFTADPAVIEYAMIRVMSCVVVHYLITSYEISGGCLRGMNHSLIPALICMGGTVGLRIFYIFTWFPGHRSFRNLFLVYPISWIVTGAIMMTAYFMIRRKEFRK